MCVCEVWSGKGCYHPILTYRAEFIQQCWMHDADDRPAFSIIVKNLDKEIENISEYFKLNSLS